MAGGYTTAAVIFAIEYLMRVLTGRTKDLNEKIKEDEIGNMQPPPYHTLFNPEHRQHKIINGRDYWVIKSKQGEINLVPMRTPSALLFQSTKY